MSIQPVTFRIGPKEFLIEAMPLGKIKKVIVLIGNVAQALQIGAHTEQTFDDMVAVLAVATDMPAADLEALPTTITELSDAFEAVVQVSGMEELLRRAKDRALGEPKPGASPASIPSMSSTPASSPLQDGPGSTSTHA